MQELRTQIDFGKFIPEQKAAIAAMTGPLEPIKAQCAEYQRRRDACAGASGSIGWDGAGQPRLHVRLGTGPAGPRHQHGVLHGND